MKRCHRCGLFGTVFAIAAATVSPDAVAQTDAAVARVLFDEGRKLASEGKYESACPKLEESQKLDPGMGTLYNLADCWEHIGRTASAWARYLEVADAAARAKQPDRERIARARAAALESKLPRLLVEVKATDPGLVLERDGVPFGSAQWGTALPVDPGEHTIVAHAAGRRSWQTKVSLTAQGKTTTVTVPSLSPEPGESAAAPSTSPPSISRGDARQRTAATAESGKEPGANESGGTFWSRVPALGWALGGVGVAGLAVGTAFGLQVIAKNNDADKVCPTMVGCSPTSDRPAYDAAIADARSAQTWSIVGFGVGGAALVASALVVLTAKQPGGEPSDATAHGETNHGGLYGVRFTPILNRVEMGGSVGAVW